jgi:membrane protease YdiL (CAAX protease family)
VTEPSYRRRTKDGEAVPSRPPATERLRRMLTPAPKPGAATPAAVTDWQPSSGWSLSEMVAVLGVTLLVTVIEGSLLASDAVTSLSVNGQMVTRGVVVLVYYSILLAFVWWLTARRHRSFTESVGLRSFEWGRSLLYVGGAFVAIRAAEFAYAYLVPAPDVDLTRLFGASLTGILVSIVLWGLVAPFVEEVVFRGVVLGALTDLVPVWAAVGLSAVLFAAVHFSLYLFVPFVVAGVALAIVARRTDSLWPAVILHSLYNLSSLAFAYLLHR